MPNLPLLRRTLLIGSLLVAAAAPSLAQTPTTAPVPAGPIPLADFFKRPQYTQMIASPNGRYLASTTELHGRLNLVVIDLQERKGAALTNYDNIDIGDLRWVGNDYILFRAIQLNAPSGQDSPRAGGLFAVAMDGSGITQLAKTASQFARSGLAGSGFVAMSFVARVPGSKDEAIMAAVLATDDSADLYRVNLSTGKYRILTQGRPTDRISNWVLDSKLVPRVTISRAPGASTEAVVHYRAGPDSPWSVLLRFDATKPPATVPLGFDADDKQLIVASNEGRRNMAIFRYDPEAKKLGELIAQHPQYDLGASPQGADLDSLIVDPRNRQVIGVRVDGDREETVWLDPAMAKIQATVDATLPGRTNVMRRSGGAQRFVVTSYNDTSPGRFYIFDDAKRSLEEVGPSRPWLEGRLAQVRPFRLKTRDGLEIPSYYVLPRDYKPGTRLPTIVHIHGGPMARDVVQGGRYGYSFGVSEAQVLASRGYAVVLPNFRITPELGSDIYYAGFGTYGMQMSDDHEDAAKWAVDQGFADPARICISGASYGGYAALQALTRPSNPFACAISGLPVADLAFQRREADYASSPAAVEYWRRIQGVKDWNDPLVAQMSPINHADKIKKPVFMYIGERDERTPPRQARRMADALQSAGNPVKGFFVGKGEGHGYGVAANNVKLYEEILPFLRQVFGQ